MVAGKRVCLGKGLAMLEIKLGLAMLLGKRRTCSGVLLLYRYRGSVFSVQFDLLIYHNTLFFC